jgi:GR25 family glycosyltransferase involved in LPS biosynthesis
MFSAGHPNACLSIAELFQDHQIVFLHQQEGRDWWDDVTTLKDKTPKRILISECKEKFDLIIEISFFLSAIQRKTLSQKTVWYNRKPGLFSDLEASVYGCRHEGRDLEGLDAIWLADIFTSPDDISYMKTLYPSMMIEIVPWIWTPTIVESHREAMKSPVWLNGYTSVPETTKWSIHTLESNSSNTSSCTLPLVILKHAIESKPFPISNVYLHNTELLKKNTFFKENVLHHTSFPDISYNLVGRQRSIDWVYDPKSLVLSHSRFINLKLGNLESAWVGIPVVHNNEILFNLGHGLEKTYYKSNSVTDAATALHKVVFDTSSISYIHSFEGLTQLRNTIMLRFHPDVHSNKWNEALSRLNHRNLSISTPIRTRITVLFTDMWENFNEAYNFFTLALTSCGIEVQGYSTTSIPIGHVPDLVIFGPFGNSYSTLPDEWPKVHYTGENTGPKESAKLNLGYQHIDSESYFRLPLWMISIDWFGANKDKIQNPLPLPIDSCTKVTRQERKKFCAFIVSNPSNEIRNAAYHSLHSYKPVDSAGRLFNSIGDELLAGAGGGGGELKKHEFLKNYRFCIAYENSSSPGYTTEKLLHAKAAGCIPIYWGDPEVVKDFDTRGFIDVNSLEGLDLIRAVNEVEMNEDLYMKYTSIPALSLEKLNEVRKTLSQMICRLLIACNRNELLPKVPEMLGAATTEEALSMAKLREPRPIEKIETKEVAETDTKVSLLVTGATQSFWPYVIMWLNSIEQHRKVMPSLRARVYVGSDVTDSTLNKAIQTYSSFVKFIRYPTEVSEDFPDFWDAKHYAWKLWIMKTIANDTSLKGQLVFYMDSASILVRWPKDWIQMALKYGVSLLDDPTQTNDSWCHSIFCEALSVTPEEKASNQIAACLLLFVAGHPNALNLFDSSYELAKRRSVIVGEKWAGIDKVSGKPYGHRHDQSILSILSERMSVPRVPLDNVYCDVSMRATFHSGKSVYVHRGNVKAHQPYLPGIDEMFVVNLDRREDRKNAFMEHHPDLKGYLRRLPAYDGLKLTLGPYLARIFKPNDFFWKKAVMGCALSHMKLLWMLTNESPEINSYCIFEDDGRLQKGWQAAWAKVYPNLPSDWDCVYLGGVLPPNKPGLLTSLERVAPGLARIAPNQIFGQSSPTRYFHFCTYAYVISRAGAKKILNSIFQKDGYWTSADHMMCNPVDVMNNYVIDPLVAGASQDDDPIYQTADFNNFSRMDKFDSDLWNNNERFSLDDVGIQMAKQAPIDIGMALAEAEGLVTKPIQMYKPRFVCLDICKMTTDTFYELGWLEELFQIPVVPEAVSMDDPLDERPLIAIVRKTLWDEQIQWLKKLSEKGRIFKIVHLSDEFSSDPIDFYKLPSITGVLRNYWRTDLPNDPKILVIPLGYHWKAPPEILFDDRPLVWSFAGTDWKNRSRNMRPLNILEPNETEWYQGWRDPKNLSEVEYMKLMMNSKFIPCPRGQNVETYRFYEALECGCIPLFVDEPETSGWMRQFDMGSQSMDFFRIESWSAMAEIMEHFNKNPSEMLQYRSLILKGWKLFKTAIKEKVRKRML